ncbi:naked cuticle-like protein 3 [Scomber scombrus]|uniref:Protein naked cuticle homolog n=1 Tax=Scomber scombrus TaxID=13677 RepID=A0AAV1MR03_SCOSC
MGKFQSKLASKRRQRPEGGSLASSVLTCQRELELIRTHKTKLTEDLCRELREDAKPGHNCHLEVVLPTEKGSDRDNIIHYPVNKQTRRNNHVGDTECNMVLEDDSREEWVFTLYNFDNNGKVTKEDMSGLIHSMYEALEASVKQPYGGTTALRIKLVVTPSAGPHKTGAEKEQSASQEKGSPVRRVYCVDENIERRNHYLDLAGIENYTSKFDNTESLSQEPRHDTHSALQHHRVVVRENCISPGSPRGLSALHSLKGRNGVEGKSCRLHGQHSASLQITGCRLAL